MNGQDLLMDLRIHILWIKCSKKLLTATLPFCFYAARAIGLWQPLPLWQQKATQTAIISLKVLKVVRIIKITEAPLMGGSLPSYHGNNPKVILSFYKCQHLPYASLKMPSIFWSAANYKTFMHIWVNVMTLHYPGLNPMVRQWLYKPPSCTISQCAPFLSSLWCECMLPGGVTTVDHGNQSILTPSTIE